MSATSSVVTSATAIEVSKRLGEARVFPITVAGGRKVPLIGKSHPFGSDWSWKRYASNEPIIIDALWAHVGGSATIAVACAISGSGLAVFDQDLPDPDVEAVPASGSRLSGKQELELLREAKTMTARSVSRGLPHYYLLQPPVTTAREVGGPHWLGGEIKGVNGYVAWSGELLRDGEIQQIPAELLAQYGRPLGSLSADPLHSADLADWLDSVTTTVAGDYDPATWSLSGGSWLDVMNALEGGKRVEDLGLPGWTAWLAQPMRTCARKVEAGMERRKAMLDMTLQMAIEAEAGCYPLRPAYEASVELYEQLRDGYPGRNEHGQEYDGWGPHRRQDLEGMWAGTAGNVAAGLHVDKIQEHRERLTGGAELEDLGPWFGKLEEEAEAASDRMRASLAGLADELTKTFPLTVVPPLQDEQPDAAGSDVEPPETEVERPDPAVTEPAGAPRQTSYLGRLQAGGVDVAHMLEQLRITPLELEQKLREEATRGAVRELQIKLRSMELLELIKGGPIQLSFGAAVTADPRPDSLLRDDGAGLLYAGDSERQATSHMLVGDKASGKTWVAAALAVEQMALGRRVAWFDWEMSKERVTRRLLTCGATEAMGPCFLYFPQSGLPMETWLEKAKAFRPNWVIVDSVVRALSAEPGVQADFENSSGAFVGWLNTAVEPLMAAGASVLMIDHTGHADKTRGRGSSSKAQQCDVAQSIEMVIPPAVGKSGRAMIVCRKARYGEFPQDEGIATVRFDATAGGELRVSLTVPSPADRLVVEGRKADVLGVAILELVATRGPMTGTEIRDAVGGKREAVDDALGLLEASGKLVRPATGRSRPYSLGAE